MKGNKLYHGYSENEIFYNEEDKLKILSMKDLDREKIIAERVEKLNIKRERDELLNDKKDKNNENKKNKNNIDENYSSDSEESGEIKNEHKNTSKRKKTANSIVDEESSLSMEIDEDKQVKGETRNITLEEIEKIRLNRDFFAKYYNYSIFDENVKGAFIRINLSSMGKVIDFNYSGYDIGEIETIIINENRPYNFMGNKCTKYIKLKYSTSDDPDLFNFKVISNGKILEVELNRWLKDKEKLPSSEDIALVQQNIAKIKSHMLTNDELNNILAQKKKDRIKYKDSTLNVTQELDLAIEQYRYYKEKYEEEKEKENKEKMEKGEKGEKGEKDKEKGEKGGEKNEKENYLKLMKEIEEDIKQLEKMKEERDKKEKMNSENDIVAKINEDIRKKQRMDEKMSLLTKKRKKDRNDSEHKIFKRVDCHPTTLFDKKNKNNEEKKEEKEKRKESTNKEKENKKKKNNNNFCYAQKIKQLKDYMNEKQSLIDEMMGKEKTGKDQDDKETKENKNIDDNNKNNNNIDMSLFSKLASINYEIFNKMIKEQNKKNTLDPQVRIIGLNGYLQEFCKE